MNRFYEIYCAIILFVPGTIILCVYGMGQGLADGFKSSWDLLKSSLKKKVPNNKNDWRGIDDLPAHSEDEENIRCVIVWQDADHELDIGVEVTNLANIRDGDYKSPFHLNPAWKTVMDAPAFKKKSNK